ncbi:acyl-CoA thioester hydrolase/BAAT C-terminal domain-containing protein [Isoptericola chiayiensis]|uniref:Acyl-CoA thioester hydrolase/BAAT C-terminal domain-containing protein n=1 Tax=Isoptericola chiayiensis TaxID=579446 RepID=A0ABP8Y617_9MICO|nr:acyl-CoA thioesterase/bile acid-CoA:amino acid N-acyltransferase family protein [Isoptericola chiayiensis]NOV99143.1 dienelactone hydrolase [Isoptericola chiayiensis]
MARRRDARRSAVLTAVAAALVLPAACTASPDPEIEVTEVDGPFVPLDVTLAGLPPGQEVTLEAATAVGGGVDFVSQATFTVADDGTVVLAETVPESGDWESADPTAPLWAMVAESRYYAAMWEEPFVVDLVVRDDAGEALATTTVERPGTAPGVESRRVDDRGLVAEYSVPSGLEGRRPALVVFGGSEGGLNTGAGIARTVASLGYPALAISFFGAPGQLENLERVPVETFLEALRWLRAQPEVDTERVMTFGVSRGGEMALWLAAERPELVHGAIAPVGAGALVCGIPDFGVPAWTLDGEPLADVCPNYGRVEEMRDAAVDVADIGGPVVLACGGRDELWPSCDYAQHVLDRRGDEETVLVRHEDAGHAVALPPYVPIAFEEDLYERYDVTSAAVPAATHQVRVEFWQAVAATLAELREE